MKKFVFAAGLLFFASIGFSQNFNPAPSEYQEKLEKYIARFGSAERVYLNDEKGKTFDARGGGIYLVAFVYDIDYKGVRRMLVYEVGSNGEKKNLKYPEYSKGYRGSPNTQMFHVRLDPEGDNNTITTYKIDPDPGATIYIYKALPQVK